MDEVEEGRAHSGTAQHEQRQQAYRLPPKEIVDAVDAPALPSVSLSPNGEWLLLKERPAILPIASLAQPELRLAGIRFHPSTNSRSRQGYCSRLWVKRIADQREEDIHDVPGDSPIGNVLWSPDSRLLQRGGTVKIYYLLDEGYPHA